MNKPIAGQSSGMPDNTAQPTEVLAGSIERVTFHNGENGFCVLRVKVRGHRDLVTVVGHAAEISAGEWVTLSGVWVNDRDPRPAVQGLLPALLPAHHAPRESRSTWARG